jgi:hypothetical protein
MIFESSCLEPRKALESPQELLRLPRPCLLGPIYIHEREPSRIPNLVGKRTVAISSALAKRNVRARRRPRRQSKASSVGTEALNAVQRVDYVAWRKGTLSSFLSAQPLACFSTGSCL